MFSLFGAIILICSSLAVMPGASAQVMQSGDKTDSGILDGTKQRRLDSARRSWKAAGVRSYSFRITRSCFCPRAENIRIVVRGGRPAASTVEQLLDVATVPRMFRRIQRSIDAKVASIKVTYGRRGVPSSISIDGSRLVADDELGYTIALHTAEIAGG